MTLTQWLKTVAFSLVAIPVAYVVAMLTHALLNTEGWLAMAILGFTYLLTFTILDRRFNR